MKKHRQGRGGDQSCFCALPGILSVAAARWHGNRSYPAAASADIPGVGQRAAARVQPSGNSGRGIELLALLTFNAHYELTRNYTTAAEVVPAAAAAEFWA